MNVIYYADAKEFLAHAGKYLAKDEARYGLVLGIAGAVERFPQLYGKEAPWFCSIGTGKEINAVAVRTPPHGVLLAYFFGDIKVVAEKLVAVVYDSYKTVPGIVAEKELGDMFADIWCKKYATKVVYTMEQRIYRLDKVNDVPMSPGRLRVCTAADKDLVKKWWHSFYIDIGGVERHEPEGDPTRGIEFGFLFFWEVNGKPVSMAAKTRPTEKGMTVGGVYTPPELRDKGYATSCVAEVSRNILQSGKEFCALYTNLANPTSNSIYMKIGYKPVCDSVEHTFEVTK
jgi:hypothetical protein